MFRANFIKIGEILLMNILKPQRILIENLVKSDEILEEIKEDDEIENRIIENYKKEEKK